MFDLRIHKVINRIALRRDGIINENGSMAFKVVASDNGYPRRSSTVNVTVNIVEAGDDSPVFNRYNKLSLPILKKQEAHFKSLYSWYAWDRGQIPNMAVTGPNR